MMTKCCAQRCLVACPNFFSWRNICIQCTYAGKEGKKENVRDHPKGMYPQIWWFQTMLSLYALKQQNDIRKTIDERFCLDPLLLPWSIHTSWMVLKVAYGEGRKFYCTSCSIYAYAYYYPHSPLKYQYMLQLCHELWFYQLNLAFKIY